MDNNSSTVDPLQVLRAIKLAIQPALNAEASIQASQQSMAMTLDDTLNKLPMVLEQGRWLRDCSPALEQQSQHHFHH